MSLPYRKTSVNNYYTAKSPFLFFSLLKSVYFPYLYSSDILWMHSPKKSPTYQDSNFYYFRKPAGIPSTFGNQPSFLDFLLQQKEKSWIVQSLYAFFWTEKELWLLNRLDNETSGLLYFAKTPRAYQQFKSLQSTFQLHKYYLAEVYGNLSPLLIKHQGPSTMPPLQKGGKGGSNTKHYFEYEVTFPLAHHKFNPDRMVVIKHESDIKKAKWTLHHLSTEILEFQFLPATTTTILLLRIQKGIRHQIRAHLAALGFPICGDRLYSKSDHKDHDKLQLFSVGLETI